MAEPQASENQQTERQADQVIQGFKQLADLADYRTPSVASKDNPVEEVCSRSDIFADLHSNLLPLLHQQLTDLSTAVRGLSHEPVSQLKFIRDLQPEIAQTLRQTANATKSLMNCKVIDCSVRNDQHFKELKAFRLEQLNSCYYEMGMFLTEWFLHCRGVIEHLQHEPPNQQRTTGSDSDKDEIPIRLLSHLGPILSAVSLSKAPELHLLKDCWIPDVKNIGIKIDGLLSLIHQTTGREESGTRPVILLAKSMVPVFKLSRLFFDKLLREGMGKRDVPLFTGMCSDQLELLENAPSRTDGFISHLRFVIQEAERDEPDITKKQVLDALEELWTAFPSYVLLAHLYIVPPLPDIQGWSSEICFKAWLTNWDTLFNVAIHNAFQIACSIS